MGMREVALMQNEQREHVEQLRGEFAYYADAAREYDKLADDIERIGRTFSPAAHQAAVEQVREMRDDAIRARDHAREQLKEADGWQTVRPSH